MKILIVTPSYKPAYYYGGPIYSVSYLAEHLSKNNEVLVLSTLANGKEELNIAPNSVQNIDGVQVKFFKRQTKDHTHFSFGLFRYLWKHGISYDIIHIQSWWNLTAIISALIACVKGMKYIVSPRGMLSPYTYNGSVYKRILHLLLGNFLLKKTILHLTAIDEENKVKQLNSKYRTFVLPNYFDTNISKFERTPATKFNILFLGRIHPKKGIDILLESLAKCSIDFQLNIIGDGDAQYIEHLKFLSEKLGITGKIAWLGPKLSPEKYQYYTNADIMVLPSRDENFANTVLESLLCGTAVILSKQVGLADFVNEHELGWVYNGNANELTLAIESAFSDSVKRNKIREIAPRIISDEFNAEELTIKYLFNYTKQWN